MADNVESLETSLQLDDVRITHRRIVSDYATEGIPADAFQEMEIEIPLRGEEINVRKRPVVRESVVVTKYAVERIHPVQERVRRETLAIDGEDIVDAHERGDDR